MNNSIFYSWQSDLPSNTNRNFIEGCIKEAIKMMKKTYNFSLEIRIDKDTKDETGTPDIVNTIFNKIEKSKIFVADISIVNSNSEGRKTPNPNVLLELGYASKVVGWERIICIFNKDFGDFEDLPFDLRFRRPLVYSLNDKNKSEVRKDVAKIICDTIIKLDLNGMLYDEINDYTKVKVDKIILTIISSLSKMIFGYEYIDSTENTSKLLNLSKDEIKIIFQTKKFLNFQVSKEYEKLRSELSEIYENYASSNYAQRDISMQIISIIKWIERFDKINSPRFAEDMFIQTNDVEKEYYVIYGPDINPKNEERYILLKRIDKQSGKVIDFGDIRGNRDSMLNYVTMNNKYINFYIEEIDDFIGIINKWLGSTNGEFIIDLNKDFEIKGISQKNTYEKDKIIKIPTVSESNILFLIHNLDLGFGFDYFTILNLNIITYLIKYGFIMKNQGMVKLQLKNEIVGEIECSDEGLINEYKKDDTLFDITVKDRLEYDNAKNGCVNIDKIYINKEFIKLYKILSEALDDNISEKTKNIILKILDNLNTNLKVYMKNCVNEFIIDFFRNNNENFEVGMGKYYVKFKEFHNDPQYEYDKLKSEIRKQLLNENIIKY